jgi:hypothetical protein
MWLGTLAVGESIHSKREHRSVAGAGAGAVALHFVLDAAGSLTASLLMAQASEASAARLRPDFLARCQPRSAPTAVELECGHRPRVSCILARAPARARPRRA